MSKFYEYWGELSKPICHDFGFILNRMVGLFCLPFVIFNKREGKK